jgi:hypothetical protein
VARAVDAGVHRDAPVAAALVLNVSKQVERLQVVAHGGRSGRYRSS